MSESHFDIFFKQVAGGRQHEPYPYQIRLAGGTKGKKCESKLIDIPTGLGKTAAVVMAWLWNRVILGREDWPRRLVYCLPMRTLVEQTRDNVNQWLEAAWQINQSTELEWLKTNSPVILMGGEKGDEDAEEWDLYPEKPAILIGTQDMLLSRALNRGYGMSRYRWPMHFGLLNNDCLWVLDETQLMGVGIETSSQMEGLRRAEKLGTVAPSKTWWMSATLDEAQLTTVDFPASEIGLVRCELSQGERASENVCKRLSAEKRLHLLPVSLTNGKKDDVMEYTKTIAAKLHEMHRADTLTLAVFNRVERAQEVYRELQKLEPEAEIALIHSRFRSGDRAEQQRILEKSKNRIVIATQAIEAGVDVSARVLVSELAPWSSLVQRFGRCHRYGEIDGGADIYWIDLKSDDPKAIKSLALPYEPDELAQSRRALASLESANVAALAEISIPAPQVIRPVIRRKDLVDLADTTPDLAGNDLDISRYVRDGEDTDVQVFWRYVDNKKAEPAPESHKAPHRDELCRVSVFQFSKFLPKDKEKRRVWKWDHLEKKWQQANRAVPGQIYLIDVEMGGYSPKLGWTRRNKDKPTVFPAATDAPDDYGGDRLSRLGTWITLADHTRHVCDELDSVLQGLSLTPGLIDDLRTAALWHDVGKAHFVFQNATNPDQAPAPGELWAKAKSMSRYERSHFRHELVSALLWLQNSSGSDADLIAFLIAAHHGKVRFSIRALPGEDPAEDEKLFARGVWDGDRVPAPPLEHISICGLTVPADELDLAVMQLGAGSWLDRMTALLTSPEYGPFRLGFLETMLRAADMRASAKEEKKGPRPEGRGT